MKTDAYIEIAAADKELIPDCQVLIAQKVCRITESGTAGMCARYIDAGDRSPVINGLHPVCEGRIALRRCIGSEKSLHHRKSTDEQEDQHHQHNINDSFFFHNAPSDRNPGRARIAAAQKEGAPQKCARMCSVNTRLRRRRSAAANAEVRYAFFVCCSVQSSMKPNRLQDLEPTTT